MNTFGRARLKLTAWYLAIIMVISMFFSIAIYQVLNIEFERFERAQRIFIERMQSGQALPPPSDIPRGPMFRSRVPINPELIAESKKRIIFILTGVNLLILAVSGGLGYLLAGRTLKPITNMVNEQNRFITDASHELKTPLTALRSEFEVALMKDNKISSSQAKNTIKSGLEEIIKLQSLTENLLTFSAQKIIHGQSEFVKIRLLDVFDEAVNRINPLAKNKNIQISIKSDNYLIMGNKHRLEELFIIILDNAVKYSSSHREIKISSSRLKNQIQILIADQGVGMKRSDLNHAFDRFYRADTSRSLSKGYGLGLSIARQIVEEHNGTISIKSEINKGTDVLVRLPISLEEK